MSVRLTWWGGGAACRAGVVAAFWLAGAMCSMSRDFYVNPGGADSNPGTKSRPFATLEAARDAVRRIRHEGRWPKDGVTVWLRGGDYVRTAALELTAEDSGTASAPVTWQGVDTESARLFGGRKLSGFAPIQDPAIRSRLDPAAVDHVRQLDLRRLGISQFGEMKSRGFGRATTPAHCEIFFEGRPMTLARWPNEGAFEKIAGFPETAGKGDDHGGKVGELPGGFVYAGDRPRRWRDVADLWVHGYWAWDWANSYEHVASLNPETRLIKTAPPHGLYGFRAGQRFYFLNVLEELDAPGEWFLDRANGVLYFWPPAAATEVLRIKAGRDRRDADADLAVALSLLDQPLLKLSGVSHVRIQGLILEATRGSGVEIRGGTSNRIAGCVLRNLGDYGVVIEGGQGHGVVSCDVLDTGDGGVTMSGGDRQTLTPGGHFVENCHFQRQGRWSKCYVPAVLLSGVGLRVSHNLIHDHPHCAILFTGNDHRIEFNEIHHIALETGDVGAIYTGRDYSFRGNRIRHNFIHETGGVGMGSMGVYLDDCVSGVEVFGNIFHKVHWAAFLGGGRDHRVENNLFVDCDPAVRADGRGLDPSPVWRGMVNDYMRQQLGAVPAALYRERYPALQTLDRYYGPPNGPSITGDAFKGVPPEGNVVARNVCVGKWLEAGWHASASVLDVRDNVVTTNASLATPVRGGFRLEPDAAVLKSGFEPIPTDRIGLQDDELRRQLSRLVLPQS